MTTRMLLICHGATAATRSTAFPRDEPLEGSAVTAAADLAARLAAGSGRAAAGLTGAGLTGAARRCQETARALGVDARIDTGLGDWNLGDWAGRSLTELAVTSGPQVEAWLTDPDFDGHGGESLTSVLGRVGDWLEQPPTDRPSRLIAVTHPAWIRAAVVHALRGPAHSFWRIDVAPLSVVELRGDPGRWALYPRS